jgi:hypothetical protein
MKPEITPIDTVIPESHIVVFSPHYDDFLFTLGGYVVELRKQDLLTSKQFHIIILFSRSNYLAGTGEGNLDTSLERLKVTTGKRVLEDMGCIDELLGPFTYRYELAGEEECFVRGGSYADSEMEFPHGMYEDFSEKDHAIFARMKERVRAWAQHQDTALVFPTAIKEHMDHFITREAAMQVYKEASGDIPASFYFQEDKPYGGIADEEELARLNDFVETNRLDRKVYYYDPEAVIELAFKHYMSQVEEVYKKGIRRRARMLQEMFGTDRPCDQIYHP